MNRPQISRMWINQPSKLQPHHKLHGTNVLMAKYGDQTEIYFLSSEVVSQLIDPSALSKGWFPKKVD